MQSVCCIADVSLVNFGCVVTHIEPYAFSKTLLLEKIPENEVFRFAGHGIVGIVFSFTEMKIILLIAHFVVRKFRNVTIISLYSTHVGLQKTAILGLLLMQIVL